MKQIINTISTMTIASRNYCWHDGFARFSQLAQQPPGERTS
ncbi:MAG TPA: hypothetical protein VFJ15_12225 [Oleiagrimonas sp.]|nr:hypothetical protein [Oleiagrimonas sp.]